MARTFAIDGQDFSTLEGFYSAIGEALIPGRSWGRNLNAFNDVLSWPLQNDPEPYVLVWRHSRLSRKRLNHGEVERFFEQILERLPRDVNTRNRLALAQRCQGPTLFDWLVEIIRKHPDWLTLRLE